VSLLAIAVLAAGCGVGADDEALPATVEPSIALLPPQETEPVAGADDAALAVEPVEPSAEPARVEPEVLNPLRCLSRRARVAQLLLPLATQPELFGARVFAADGEIGGVGLLGEPDEGLAAELAALQQESFVPLIIASDEEGGSVQRLARLLGPLPSAAASAQSKSPEEVRNQWVEYGSRVKALGIDMIFGPVVDVGSGPGIESRSFGGDPAVVTEYAGAVVDGLLEAGITPVLKHFPGHGRASADSHLQLPTTPPFNEMRSVDLVPYTTLLSESAYKDSVAVMVGHLTVPGLSDGVPTSLSPETISGVLRSELGFDGLVITDALNMGAIVNTYGRLDALDLAVVAGADLLILGSLADVTPALDHLTSLAESDPAFAAIVDNRVGRVLASKGQAEICQGAQ